jgi:hypothetical protein
MPDADRPQELPARLLTHPEMINACRVRDFARVFRLVKNRAGIYPSMIARRCLVAAQVAPPYGHPLEGREVLQPVQKVVFIALEGTCHHEVLGQLVQLVDRSRVARLDVSGLVKLLLLDDDATGQPKRPPASARLPTGSDVCQNGQGGKAGRVHLPLVAERSPQLRPRLVSQLGITELSKIRGRSEADP